MGTLRESWAGQGPVTNDGPDYALPLEDGTGLGKPLKSSIHPLREDIPIYLAAEGPKNIALAGELCDGWLALFYSPHHDDFYREALDLGLSTPGARTTKETFEVSATVPFIVTADTEQAAAALKPTYALYFAGMGGGGGGGMRTGRLEGGVGPARAPLEGSSRGARVGAEAEPSRVVIKRELPRMRSHPNRVHLGLALVAHIRLDQPSREHVPALQELVIRLECVEAPPERRGHGP